MSRAAERLAGLRRDALPIAQCALAAALAWLVATRVVGHQRPFFAPIAAIIALGVGVAGRRERAVEVAIGVAVGILVADALVALIGTGTWQIALVVGLAMCAAVLLGGGPLLVTQAASSAVLVATLSPSVGGGAFSGVRFVDALVGGTIGVLVHSLLPAVDPIASVYRALAPLVAEVAGVLDDVAGSLRRGELSAAAAALERARQTTAAAARFDAAVDLAVDTARSVAQRRRDRGRVDEFAEASPFVDLVVRDVRVLARGALRALELRANVPPEVPESLEALSRGVGRLGERLSDEDRREEARREILHAAALATRALEGTQNMAVSAIVAQVRSTAVDLLRGLGADRQDAIAAVRAAAAELPG